MPDPARYAKTTKIDPQKSESQIRQMLKEAGATSMSIGNDDDLGLIAIQFKLGGYRIRFMVPTPDRAMPPEVRVNQTSKTRPRTDAEKKAALGQAERALWRGLYQTIFFKLYSVALGFEIEDEFLAFIVNPQTGKTVKEEQTPVLKQAYGLPPGPNRLMIAPPKGAD